MNTFADGYEGVTVAGLAIVRLDGEPMVFLAQRTFDETDDPTVQETWEFPGGHLSPGETPFAAAQREFEEEIGFPLPYGEVTGGWRSEDGHYQGFVYEAEGFPALVDWQPTSEVQAVGWFTRDEAMVLPNLRPEVRESEAWGLIAGVSGNEEQDMDEAAQYASIPVMPIPVHGVVAPEDTPTGDGRGFNAGSMSRRPLRLPFRDTTTDIGAHGGAFAVGSVDRLMRADGLVQWEGLLMPAPQTEGIVEKMQFFGGRYGVSVDGDQGSVDVERTAAEDTLWFDTIRAAGLTAVDIPAFHEAYVAFGHHPTMPTDDVLAASAYESGDLIGARVTFDRGPGWVTDPVATNRIHDYWTKKGEPGYAKVGWGTGGDFTRAKALIGAKIAQHSPEKMRFLNQIIAQWHFDALGYWPGDCDKPGNDTTPEGRAKRAAAAAATHGIMLAEQTEDTVHIVQEGGDLLPEEGSAWEVVLTSSAGKPVRPPASYFDRHPDTGATFVDEPDENGIRRTYGYAAERGVCHIGMSGRCVEPPIPDDGQFPEFHLGYTRTSDGSILRTGVIAYRVEHRDAHTILTETAEQSHFDNVETAWSAVRLGVDERGIWFSGVVLPGIPEEDIVLIEATGQVSGEWKYGSLRALQSVNVPGYPVMTSSAAFDDEGNVTALVAVTTGKDEALVASLNGVETSECYENSPKARMAALARIDAEVRMDALREQFNWVDVAEDLMAEAHDDGRVAPVGLREDGAIVYEKDGEIPGTDTIVAPMPDGGQ